MLIIVCGLPGSGKSSLSKEIMRIVKAEYLNSDIIRKELIPRPEYTEDEKRQVYVEMARKAGELLKQGKNVIADATFFTGEYREMMTERATQAKSPCRIILCSLPETYIRQRIERRKKSGRNPSDADYEVYLQLKKQFEPIQGSHLELDFSLPRSERIRIVKKFIGEADE